MEGGMCWARPRLDPPMIMRVNPKLRKLPFFIKDITNDRHYLVKFGNKTLISVKSPCDDDEMEYEQNQGRTGHTGIWAMPGRLGLLGRKWAAGLDKQHMNE